MVIYLQLVLLYFRLTSLPRGSCNVSGSAFGRVQVSLENNRGFLLTGSRHAIVTYISDGICIELHGLLAINKHGFGMKCSHTGHTLPHRLLLLLKPGNQTSREVFPPLQYPRGIITSTHNLGGLSTPREDYHLSLS